MKFIFLLGRAKDVDFHVCSGENLSVILLVQVVSEKFIFTFFCYNKKRITIIENDPLVRNACVNKLKFVDTVPEMHHVSNKTQIFQKFL